MGLDELNRNRELHKQLEMAYEMAQSIRDRAGLRATSMNAMPRGSGISDHVGEIAAAAADLDQRIREIEDQVEAGDQAIRAFANSTGDVRLQQIIQFRYIACLTWERTAELMGDRYTPSGCRRLLHKFLRVHLGAPVDASELV